MRNPSDIALDIESMTTLLNLTGAFEGLASMHIAQIKDRVVSSQQFFAQLWNIYDQIRVDELFRFGRQEEDQIVDKELLIAITAEGGFSGDIDKKLVDELLKDYDKNRQDVIVIGHHGAIQLARAGVGFKRYFKLPASDDNINVKPLANEVAKYRTTVVYYQEYISLLRQNIKKLDLHEAITSAGQIADKNREIIDESTYIFEPSSFAVMAHLEHSMMEITLSQAIFDSKLAQYASRFRAMRAAHDKSQETHDGFKLEYNHARRTRTDERLKEIINGMRAAV